MNWEKNKEYQRQLAELENSWRIERDIQGKPNIANEVMELTRLQLGFVCNDLSLIINICESIYKWKTTSNTYYMDEVLLDCVKHKILPPPVVLQELALAADRRLSIGHEGLPGSSASLQRDRDYWQAYILMANLCYRGLELKQAASKAARWLITAGRKPIKASTLDGYYSARFRATGQEARLFESWDRTVTPEINDEWARLIKMLPDTPIHERGARR